MAGTAKSQLNHYQVLGVSPDAAGDEIARAFAREGSAFRPHAFGSLTELCLAYETLRDPIKRRAYDETLGLAPKPDLQNRSIGTRPATAVSVALGAPVEQHAVKRVPHPGAQPASKTPVMPPPGAVQSGTLRPAGHVETDRIRPSVAKPALPLGPGAELNARAEPRFLRGAPPRLSLEDELGVEARPVDWRRAGMALGTVVVTACVLGGLAGWWSAIDVEMPQPENVVSVALPQSTRSVIPTEEAAVPPTPMSASPRPRQERPRPIIATAAQIERAPVASSVAGTESPSQQGDDLAPIEQAAVDAPASSTVAANMPLPDRTIARTIQRIGYSCDSVASTVPVEGEAPGVYKITCNSGQSYQARPVNGRYRFRRWSKL